MFIDKTPLIIGKQSLTFIHLFQQQLIGRQLAWL
jgi:hypothetical protein